MLIHGSWAILMWCYFIMQCNVPNSQTLIWVNWQCCVLRVAGCGWCHCLAHKKPYHHSFVVVHLIFFFLLSSVSSQFYWVTLSIHNAIVIGKTKTRTKRIQWVSEEATYGRILAYRQQLKCFTPSFKILIIENLWGIKYAIFGAGAREDTNSLRLGPKINVITWF